MPDGHGGGPGPDRRLRVSLSSDSESGALTGPGANRDCQCHSGTRGWPVAAAPDSESEPCGHGDSTVTGPSLTVTESRPRAGGHGYRDRRAAAVRVTVRVTP